MTARDATALDLPWLDPELDRLAPQLVAWRRHLHAHPELSFEEHETSALVASTLAECQELEIGRPTPTSVLARLSGASPGPVVALRADMDVLQIAEENAFEFASTRDGVMHSCGHDGRTAMLLGAARLLSAHRDALAGEIRFIFQHAEELPPGGAQELIAAGVMDGVDAVVGCHLMSILDAGKLAVLPGPELAAADMFEVTVKGRGGHGALPHETIDPVTVAAQLVTACSVVVSVTRIAGGSANNIIPESVELGGTPRTFVPELRAATRTSIEQIARSILAAFGAGCDFRWIEGYAAVVNDPEIAAAVAREGCRPRDRGRRRDRADHGWRRLLGLPRACPGRLRTCRCSKRGGGVDVPPSPSALHRRRDGDAHRHGRPRPFGTRSTCARQRRILELVVGRPSQGSGGSPLPAMQSAR
jgi:amidohydrolase